MQFRILLLGLVAFAAVAQTDAPAWSRLGGYAISGALAGPSGGGVSTVGFSFDGQTLRVRTSRGADWASDDRGERFRALAPFEAGEPLLRLEIETDQPGPQDDPDARVVRHPLRSNWRYALGWDLQLSFDGGESWIAISGGGNPILGANQTDIAFDPSEPERIFVANSSGLWRSADGGLSWISLNDRLPNFPESVRFSPAEPGAAPTLRALGVPKAELFRSPAPEWAQLVDSTAPSFTLPEPDASRRDERVSGLPDGFQASFRIWRDGLPISPDLTLCAEGCDNPRSHYVSAADHSAAGGLKLWAGTSDGLVWLSPDGGASWQRSAAGLPPAFSGRGVADIWADPLNDSATLAAFSGENGPRIFRTVDGGTSWDDVTADLPAGSIRAVAASGESGSIYVAGDQGVFYSDGDLRAPSPPESWNRVGDDLPPAPVEDLYLDAVAGRLYAAVEAYGVYQIRAPEVFQQLRLLSTADWSFTPAAPGSLLTVQGAAVSAVRVNGLPAPVLISDAVEAQIQTPFQVSGSRLSVELQTPSGERTLSYPLGAGLPGHLCGPRRAADPQRRLGTPVVADEPRAARQPHPGARLRLGGGRSALADRPSGAAR